MKHLAGHFSSVGRLCILLTMIFGSATNAHSQRVEKDYYVVNIVLKNNQEFIGVLKEENDSLIVLIVRDIGEMTIEKYRIKSIKSIPAGKTNNLKNDSIGYDKDYHNSTRYLINHSGYGLKKGQSYYENIYIFFNSLAYGVSDRFTIVVGGEVASLLFGDVTPVFYASPRFNFELGEDKGALSVGAIFFTVPETDFSGIGLTQAALTLGSRTNNFNFGFGVGYTTDNYNDHTVFMLSFGAIQRLSRKLSFVTDNFVFADGGFDDDGDNLYIVSAALRIHFDKPGAALNVGLWRPLEHFDILVMPMVSATIPLNYF